MATADHSGPRSQGAATPHLINDEWLHLPATKAVFAALSTPGVTVRAVGGTVRNALLGEAITDIDLATTAAPEETIRAAKAAGLKAIPTGLQHGTVTVVADRTPFEVTTLRLDVRTDGRHAEVAFTDDWHGDAARRDFTMNALYCDADGTVFDPLGGLADCMARRVRFIGDPDQRIAEDYLRIVRFYRFTAQYGGHSLGAIDMAGRRACTRGRHGLFRLSRERIGSELGKLLAGAAAPTALIAMFTDGVLLDLLGAPARLERFAAWHNVHRCLQGAARAAQVDHADAYRADGRAVHSAAALAALAGWGTHSAGQLAASLRLSNADAALVAHVLAGLPPLRVAMRRDDKECDNGERDDGASNG
ncbi:MAG: CCA tRNA nucleotidyltransferase, partial [Pseudomonadota bacterium]